MVRHTQAARQWRPTAARFAGVLGLAASLTAGAGIGGAQASAVLTWNNELLSVVRQTSALLVNGPPEVAREIAIVGTAMSDAVNAANGSPYASYAYTGGSVAGASAEAAALSAGYTAMKSIFSNPVWTGTGGNATLINTVILPEIDATYNTALAALGSGAAVTTGLNLGVAAGNAIIAKRADDGAIAAIINGLTPQAPPGSGTVPGVYVPPSASGGRPEMYPTWGTVTPFAITPEQATTVKQNIAGPPALASQAYALALLETQCNGVNAGHALSAATLSACSAAGFAGATADQTKAALFWNDPGGTIQPPGHWLQIASTLMGSQNLSLLDQARLTSLVGMALNDAGIYAWGQKYLDNLWRPITAIRACDTSANDGTVTWNQYFTTCDPTWQSEIATPPHPDYLAGHPAFSAAAAAVLEGYFGVDNIDFCSDSDAYVNGSLGFVDAITMCFSSISSASSGVLGSTYSRVAGGIHTPFAVEDARTMGDEVGKLVLGNFDIAPIPEPAAISMLLLGGAALTGFARRTRRALRTVPNTQ